VENRWRVCATCGCANSLCYTEFATSGESSFQAMAGETVLIIEDERKIADIIQAYLEKDGYRVLAAYDGRQGLDLARRERPNLIVLDLMLPELSGWEVMRALREESPVPVIMVTARDELADRVTGLELGADDYVTKPFEPRELVARVRAVLRRVAGAEVPAVVSAGDVRLDLERHEARLGGQLLDLTPTEFAILTALAAHPGRVYTRAQLVEVVAGEAYEGYERTIDSHIRNLRRKLEPDPGQPRHILTVYGVGYKFKD
jgi:DNA-binding response OmpR family regulator